MFGCILPEALKPSNVNRRMRFPMSLACSAKFITPMLNSPIDLNTISKMHPNLFNKRQDHFNIL